MLGLLSAALSFSVKIMRKLVFYCLYGVTHVKMINTSCFVQFSKFESVIGIKRNNVNNLTEKKKKWMSTKALARI